MFTCLILLFFSSVVVDAAPKSKYKKYDGPQLVYDQKQTGDYNIQLHLKDFQIIAMLGDDALGDYDYNYDYADFTVKPSGSTSISTTPKPSPSSSSSPTTQKQPSSTNKAPPSSSPPTTSKAPPSTSSPSTSKEPTSSSSTPEPIKEVPFLSDLLLPESTENLTFPDKPSSVIISNTHPYPIEVVVPQSLRISGVSSETGMKIKQTSDDLKDKNDETLPLETPLNEILSSKLSSSIQTSSSSSENTSSSSASTSGPSSTSSESPPGKIKVQILDIASELGSSSVAIVPGEDVNGDTNESILHGELASYRKCSQGYTRDKKGRCRRVRRPGVAASQFPFGFGRLASNLATRLRLKPHETPTVTPILTENS